MFRVLAAFMLSAFVLCSDEKGQAKLIPNHESATIEVEAGSIVKFQKLAEEAQLITIAKREQLLYDEKSTYLIKFQHPADVLIQGPALVTVFAEAQIKDLPALGYSYCYQSHCICEDGYAGEYCLLRVVKPSIPYKLISAKEQLILKFEKPVFITFQMLSKNIRQASNQDQLQVEVCFNSSLTDCSKLTSNLVRIFPAYIRVQNRDGQEYEIICSQVFINSQQMLFQSAPIPIVYQIVPWILIMSIALGWRYLRKRLPEQQSAIA